MVLVGAGGVFVEVMKDVAMLAAPVTREQVLEKLHTLSSWPLFDGARGRPRADAAALADIVSRVSTLMVAVGPALSELDINPVLVRGQRKGALALDARGVWSAG